MKFEYDPNGITVIDNAIPKESHIELWNYFTSAMFLWQWGGIIWSQEIYDPDGEMNFQTVREVPIIYNKQLCRVLYRDDRALFKDDLYFTFKKDMKPTDGFISMATENAQCLKMMGPILSNLGIERSQLSRIKVNNTPPKTENIFTGYHVDCKPQWRGNGMTAIYYFNTTNGCTRFKNHENVECVANRLVIFPNNQLHGGTFQTDKQNRVVANINWVHKDWVDSKDYSDWKFVDHVPGPPGPDDPY